MADYIYLLHTRLTPAQQTALEHVREAARARSMTVFLVGGAVRDLTAGSPIRDLDFAIQGDASKLKKDLQAAGGTLIGEDGPTHTLHFNFPGGVRLEVGSTLSVTYPKPGKPVYKDATILDDLRRRDFTANAMAISLNDGSFGLLMDPLNGVADLENRELRLVSNYGFIEEPSRMIRAVRFGARLGWQMEEKTNQRYENGKAENYIAALNESQRKYELEEIFHEEDPLRVLRKIEAEGWAKVLFPAWTSAKVNEVELERLRDKIGQLDAMGIHPDPSAAYFPLLTAKLAPKDVTALKASFARPGFAAEVDALEASTKAFAAQLSAKTASAPSDAWKLIFAAAPEAVLWLAHTTKSTPLTAKFDAFFGEWAQARHKIPYQLMQEMRILPALPGYDDLVETLFFAVMDNKLDTPEAAKAFLEPYSPPAPPPPVNLRRRPAKREAKPTRSRAKKPVANVESQDVEVMANNGEDSGAATPSAAKKAASVTKAPAKAASKPVAKAAAKTAKPVVKPAAKEKLSGQQSKSSKAASAPSKKFAASKAAARPTLKKPSAAVKGAAAKKPLKKQSAKAVAMPKKPNVARKPQPKKSSAKVALKKQATKNSKAVTAKKNPVKPKAASAKRASAKKAAPKSSAKAAPKPTVKAAVKKPAKAAPKGKKPAGRSKR